MHLRERFDRGASSTIGRSSIFVDRPSLVLLVCPSITVSVNNLKMRIYELDHRYVHSHFTSTIFVQAKPSLSSHMYVLLRRREPFVPLATGERANGRTSINIHTKYGVAEQFCALHRVHPGWRCYHYYVTTTNVLYSVK